MNEDYLKIDTNKVKFIQKRLIKWGQDNFSSFPWRYKQSDFHSLVSEVLLQRTRAEQVVPVFKRFCEGFPDISSLASSSENKIKEIIEPLGLHWRAKQLMSLGILIKNEKNGKIPNRFEELIKIPSVGPYVASAYISLHKNIFSPIIDSNVVRFYGRIFGFSIGPETRRKKWFFGLAEKLTPTKKFKIYNYAVLDFTRLICKPRPNCKNCTLRNKCNYYKDSINSYTS